MASAPPAASGPASLIEPAPPQFTWGAELEFLVACHYVDEKSELPEDGLPAAIPVTRGWPTARTQIHDRVSKLLEENGFPVETHTENANSLTEARLRDFRRFEIDYDYSLYAESVPGLRWIGVELKTPAEWATPMSYQVLRHAVNLINSHFRVLTNDSCGLHVHVGRAEEWMPLNYLQRMAGLFWAADRLLSCLHPPWRNYSFICHSIRQHSNLAQRCPRSHMYDSRVNRYVGAQVRHGERSTFWRETHATDETMEDFERTRDEGHFEPYIEDGAPRDLRRARSAMAAMGRRAGGDDDEPVPNEEMKEHLRVPLGEYSFETDPPKPASAPPWTSSAPSASTRPIPDPLVLQAEIRARIAPLEPVPDSIHRRERLSDMPRLKKPEWKRSDIRRFEDIILAADGTLVQDTKPSTVGVWEGVQELFATKSSVELAGLLNCEERPNFNFRAYWDNAMADPTGDGTKRTIEWRHAAGSMDPEWVSTWPQIVVGVSKWAVHAPESEYLRVIANCAAFEKGEPYDVIDLLEDMGLVAESIVAAKHVQENIEDLGLEFVTQSAGT